MDRLYKTDRRYQHMTGRISSIILLAILITLLVPIAGAHVPELPPSSPGLSGAVIIPDPAKSYAYYGTLHEPGEADYYAIALNEGDLLHVQISTPDPGPFTPAMAIMGPGISGQDQVPPFVGVPARSGVIVIPGSRPEEASYEPFTPMSMYEIGSFDTNVTAPGTYYIAVYDTGTTGRYILAPGYVEEFSPVEWVTVPLQVISIRFWQGQSFLLIFGPLIATFVIGLLVILRLRPDMYQRPSLFFWAGIVAGLLFVASGVTVLVQMGIALATAGPGAFYSLTLLFAFLPIILGILVIWLANRAGTGTRSRILMAVLGILGLVVWAGWIIGPAIAIIAAFLPDSRVPEKS
jgi:hypothetical protein